MQACDIRNFLAPCLLLLLGDAPDHGYDLVGRLRPLVEWEGDPASIYRMLRHLETDGLIRSEWVPAHSGPPRRQYEITELGRQALRAWAVDLRSVRDTIDRFLFRYTDGLQPALQRQH